MKFFQVIVFIVIGFILGFYSKDFLKVKEETKVDYNIVLEQIRSVSKLVTVEGEYSNVYNWDNYWMFDFGPFKKSAIVRVNARVSLGYDLQKMKIRAVPEEKKFIVDSLPDVSVIAIDPNVTFYDMQQGLFNSFDKNEINEIQSLVRKSFNDAIYNTQSPTPANGLKEPIPAGEVNNFVKPLIERARQEGLKNLNLINFIADNAGWTVEYKTPTNTQTPSIPIPTTPHKN